MFHWVENFVGKVFIKNYSVVIAVGWSASCVGLDLARYKLLSDCIVHTDVSRNYGLFIFLIGGFDNGTKIWVRKEGNQVILMSNLITMQN